MSILSPTKSPSTGNSEAMTKGGWRFVCVRACEVVARTCACASAGASAGARVLSARPRFSQDEQAADLSEQLYNFGWPAAHQHPPLRTRALEHHGSLISRALTTVISGPSFAAAWTTELIRAWISFISWQERKKSLA